MQHVLAANRPPEGGRNAYFHWLSKVAVEAVCREPVSAINFPVKQGNYRELRILRRG
jgi:hypothetical protein